MTQPGFGHSPITFNGRWRNPEQVCGFLDVESTEKSELDDTCLLVVHLFQFGHGIVQPDYVNIARLRHCRDDLLERKVNCMATAFFPMPGPGIVSEYAPHHLCADVKKVSPALPIEVPLIPHFDVGLVYKRGCL